MTTEQIEKRKAIVAKMKAAEKANKKPRINKLPASQAVKKDLDHEVRASLGIDEGKGTEHQYPAPTSAKPAKKAKKAKATKAPKVDPAAVVSDIPEPAAKLTSNAAPSVEIATQLQQAFDHFNAKLFEGKLEPVVFSNIRLKKSLGHFWPKNWTRRSQLRGKVHEIGMDFARIHSDPEHGDKLILSTLVHEMCHQLIHQLGKHEKGHGKFWVAAMLMVGLEPIILDAKGVPTGKATGPNSSHKIVPGGRFDEAAKELLKTGFKFQWANEPEPVEEKPKKKKKAGAKAKHTCPVCQRNAWGAPSLHLYCKGDPDSEHDLTEMDCARDDFEGEEKDGDD